MADELRPRAVPRPVVGPGQLNPEQLPGPGRLPLAANKVHMTDNTRRQLEAVGWKPGDPIPGDLGRRLQEIQAELNKERQTASLEGSELAAGWKPVETTFVKIEDLPAEKQAEIRQYLQDYKTEVAQQQQFDAMQESVDAEIPESVQGPQRDLMRQQIMAGNAAMAARANSNGGDSPVIDDRKATATPPPDMQIPAGRTFGGTLGNESVAAKLEAAAQKQRDYEKNATAATAPAAPVNIPDAGGIPARTTCQRCAWPLAVAFDIVPTLEDKQRFLAAILGLNRFEKAYPLLGGNMTVYFRSLSTPETSMLQQQLGAMVRSGESVGDGEYWAYMFEFRMVMSISKIIIGGNVTYAIPSITEWAAANPPGDTLPLAATPIPRLRDYFYANGATQEPVRRILGQTHKEFQRLVEALEFMTGDADFWIGIELPA